MKPGLAAAAARPRGGCGARATAVPAERGQRDAQEVVRIGVVGPRPEQSPAAALGALGTAGAQLLLRLEQQSEAGIGRRRARR